MRHLPNLLTIARLLATPYVFYLFFEKQYTAVLWWFGFIAFTDVLDGFIARQFKAATKLGAYLDPIADKLLLSGTFLVLAVSRDIDTWLAIVVLGRDVLILGAAVYFFLRSQKRSFPPSKWGKASTFIQVLFVMFTVGHLAGIPVELAAHLLGWLVVVLVLVSTIDYARQMRA